MARKKGRNRDGGEKANGRGQKGGWKKKRWHDDIAQETKKSIAAVLFFAFALITLLAYWSRAGMLGQLLYDLLTQTVGKAYFLVPVTLVIVGCSLLFSFRKHLYAAVIVGGGIFLVSGLAMVQLFFGDDAGGWIGFATNWPLQKLFDFWAALIIEAALFLVSILIITNFSLWRSEETDGDGEADESALKERAMTGVVEAVTQGVQRAKEAIEKAPSVRDAASAPAKIPEDEFSVHKSSLRKTSYRFPPLDLLNDDRGTPSSGDIRANANIIKRTLLNFGVDVEMGEVSIGPTVTQYTLKPAEGVKLSRISALQNDLSLALAAHPIRIEAPIPGKSLVGIEVPNRSIALVGLRSLIDDGLYQQSPAPLLFALGRDVAGAPVYANLSKMPHLMIAGATGSGKSVAIHSLITSLLYRNPPEMLKFIMVDPKRVELASYNGIPHLLASPITDAKKTIASLRWAVKEMEKRYESLSGMGVRDISGYNEKIAKKIKAEPVPGEVEGYMPYLVIIIDELADLMMSFPREVEASVVRLAQMARAVGIHLVVATQRPSVEVITGLIKANITSRLAFQVASQVDSRTILDMGGAEKLLGNGDMLYLAGDTAKPRRIQGGFISESEVNKAVKFIRDQVDVLPSSVETESEIFQTDASKALAGALSGNGEYGDDDDPLYEEARQTVIEAGKASASYLQRRLKVGYARAARLLDILEERGVIGPGEGAKPREILVKSEHEVEQEI